MVDRRLRATSFTRAQCVMGQEFQQRCQGIERRSAQQGRGASLLSDESDTDELPEVVRQRGFRIDPESLLKDAHRQARIPSAPEFDQDAQPGGIPQGFESASGGTDVHNLGSTTSVRGVKPEPSADAFTDRHTSGGRLVGSSIAGRGPFGMRIGGASAQAGMCRGPLPYRGVSSHPHEWDPSASRASRIAGDRPDTMRT